MLGGSWSKSVGGMDGGVPLEADWGRGMRELDERTPKGGAWGPSPGQLRPPSPRTPQKEADGGLWAVHSARGQLSSWGGATIFSGWGVWGCVPGHTGTPAQVKGVPFPHTWLLLLPFLAMGPSETPSWLPPPSVHLHYLHVPPCPHACRPLQPLGPLLSVRHPPGQFPGPSMGLDPGPPALPTPGFLPVASR